MAQFKNLFSTFYRTVKHPGRTQLFNLKTGDKFKFEPKGMLYELKRKSVNVAEYTIYNEPGKVFKTFSKRFIIHKP